MCKNVKTKVKMGENGKMGAPRAKKNFIEKIVTKMPLAVALKLAEEYVQLLHPHCEKIDVAGSIRRRKSEVKDIEIVCQPKSQIEQKDVFDWEIGKIRDSGFMKIVKTIGEGIKGQLDGKYMKIDTGKGIMLDLFMPDADDYYRQFAMRTGSWEYSYKVIASGWRKIGWCGSDMGLRKISDCILIKNALGKRKWKCTKLDAEHPPVWKSEEEFFEWINVKWLPPENRSL